MSSSYRSVSEKDGKPVAVIQDGDSVIFFNFRPDRAREITRAFCDEGFDRICEREEAGSDVCMLYRLR